MKVELEQHLGIGADGVEFEIGQWHVVVDGARCGYLLKDAGSNIMPLPLMMQMSIADQDEIAIQCSKLLDREVGKAIPFYIPPQGEQELLEEEDEE